MIDNIINKFIQDNLELCDRELVKAVVANHNEFDIASRTALPKALRALEKAYECLHYYKKTGMLKDSPAALCLTEIEELLK